jgi:hypothetical protein
VVELTKAKVGCYCRLKAPATTSRYAAGSIPSIPAYHSHSAHLRSKARQKCDWPCRLIRRQRTSLFVVTVSDSATDQSDMERGEKKLTQNA